MNKLNKYGFRKSKAVKGLGVALLGVTFLTSPLSSVYAEETTQPTVSQNEVRGSVVVKFVSITGETIKEQVQGAEGVVQSRYDVSQYDSPKLTYNGKTYYKVSTVGSVRGTIKSGVTEVVYKYSPEMTENVVKNITKSVKVEYRDSETNEKIKDDVIVLDNANILSTNVTVKYYLAENGKKVLVDTVANTNIVNTLYDTTSSKLERITKDKSEYVLNSWNGQEQGQLKEDTTVVYLYDKIKEAIPNDYPTVNLPIEPVAEKVSEITPVVDLPIAEISKNSDNPPVVELPIEKVEEKVPNKAPIVELPVAEIGLSSKSSPVVELPKFPEEKIKELKAEADKEKAKNDKKESHNTSDVKKNVKKNDMTKTNKKASELPKTDSSLGLSLISLLPLGTAILTKKKYK